MSIAVGLSATKAGFELIKSVRELVKRQGVDPGEVSARLLELQELMLDARTALTEAGDERARLEGQIAELTRMADFGSSFSSANGFYWHDGFPYCPVCWEVDRKPVRLGGPEPPYGSAYQDWSCSFHKSIFKLSHQDPNLKMNQPRKS
jgi:hypothetical protein